MSIIGSITDFLSGGAQGDATDAAKAGVDALRSLQTPDIATMQIQLEQLVQQGQLSPEEAQLYLQQASETANIQTDPGLKQAQMDALDSLQQIGEGGLTASDKAALAGIQSQEQAQSRGAREAILSNAAERGMGGSGLEIMSQLKNQQDAATRQSQRDLDVAGMAQDRALMAIQQAGQLGGNMQEQQFGQQFKQGQAQDAINAFNTQNMQATGNLNTGVRNDAAARNLQERQRVSDANTGTRNTQQQYNKQLIQQDFDNRYRKAGGVAQGYQNVAGQYNQNAAQNMNLVGSGIQAGATAAAASDENLKEDISDFDASSFLDTLTPHKYKYKDPSKHGQGKQVGVMAQDVEKEVPQMVKDTPEGKYLDYNKAGGPIFASLADIHNRLKKIEGEE